MKVYCSLAYLILYGVEPYILYHFFNKSFLSFKNNKWHKLGTLIFYLIIVTKQYSVLFLHVKCANILNGCFMFLAIYFYINIFYNIQLMKRIIYTCFVLFLESIVDIISFILCSHYLDMSIEVVKIFGIDNLVCTAVGRGLIIISYLLFNFMKKVCMITDKVFYRKLIVIICCNYSLISVLCFGGYLLEIGKKQMKIVIYIMIINLFIMFILLSHYIIDAAVKKHNEKENIKRSLRNVEQKLIVYQEVAEELEELKKIRHDLKGHTQMIYDLCRNKRYAELIDYTRTLNSKLEETKDLFLIENPKVSLLLSHYKKKAEDKSIKFQMNVLTKHFNMSDFDFCILLDNLLMNALEAVEVQNKTEKKYIHLLIDHDGESCCIVCENSTHIHPVMKNGKYLTTKKEMEKHGLGIKIIKDIVRKNNGYVHFQCNKNNFEVTIKINS